MLHRRDEEQHAIIFLRLAKFPETKEPVGISLDIAALQRFHRRDDELNAGFVLKLLKLCLERAAALRSDDIGLINYAGSQRRIIDRKSNKSPKAEYGCSKQCRGASHCGRLQDLRISPWVASPNLR